MFTDYELSIARSVIDTVVQSARRVCKPMDQLDRFAHQLETAYGPCEYWDKVNKGILRPAEGTEVCPYGCT